MPTLLAEATKVPTPTRKVWTRAEFERLGAIGAINPERFELIEGELVLKVSKNRPHANAFTWMQLWLFELFGYLFVTGEVPIDVHPEENQISAPEPDLMVLTKKSPSFKTACPGPSDIRLLVEVSDGSLHFDLTTKAGVYARAGIIEYWVLDVQTRRLIVHRIPASGGYQSVLVYGENEAIAPLAAPDAEFRPSQAFVA